MGKFVCTSAGHHLEARMAASGSGALLASRQAGSTIVNVDMGGGTTKFTLLQGGEIVGTAALNVGGRLVAIEDGRVVRIDEAARRAAELSGVELRLGEPLSDEASQTLCATLAGAVVDYLTTDPSQYAPFTQELLLTDPIGDLSGYSEIVMSGGVSEYLSGSDVVVKDLGPTLAREFAAQSAASGRTVQPAPERMRATVVGLSQFTTQLSGDTVHVSSPQATPRLNLPVVEASITELGEEVTAAAVTEAIRKGLVAGGREGLLDSVAVSLAWNGRPYVATLTAIAEGMVDAAKNHLPPGDIVLILSQDCARSLGRALKLAVDDGREILCIDELHLRANDFIDVGAPIQNGRVLPVVVKTLVFPEVSTQQGVEHAEVAGQIL
jgi:ethanolamine utilization protein EutA